VRLQIGVVDVRITLFLEKAWDEIIDDVCSVFRFIFAASQTATFSGIKTLWFSSLFLASFKQNFLQVTRWNGISIIVMWYSKDWKCMGHVSHKALFSNFLSFVRVDHPPEEI
jgi:hypothetical protein